MRSVPLVVVSLLAVATATRAQSFPNFESPQIHPIDVSADGLRLAAVNTPDARLCVFSVADPARPVLLREVATALEPVTARFRGPTEVWVVCHLADSVEIVDTERGVVADTLEVGDEPSDVVFADGKAFVTLATRRQVVVLDAAARTVVGRVELPCDEPRWATASADGTRVWVASHLSGNETTVVPASLAPAPPAPTNPALPPAPRTGLIVHSEDSQWQQVHRVVLNDWDVFEIDARSLTVVARYSGVGTNLFGLAERTADGSLWVANTEARNLVRFEPNLRGHIVDNRVTKIAAGGTQITPFDLNPSISYDVLPNPPALREALAQPTDVVFAPDDSVLYVAAFGTDRIGVLAPDGSVVGRIEVGSATGASADPRHKRGPRGLAHHPSADVLYVSNRLANSLSVVDTRARTVLDEIALPDPTPVALKEGRGFLYDAKLSGNGTASCASCHLDGGWDGLAWDLGDPGGNMTTVASVTGPAMAVHPMKGPMTTQSLRGLRAGASLHWRGENVGFAAFNPAFETLLGGRRLLAADMADFARFVESVVQPPNPNQARDRSYPTTPVGASAAEGRQVFQSVFVGVYQRTFACTSCHHLPDGTSQGSVEPAITQLPQPFRAAVLSTVYRRTGRMPAGGIRTSGFGLEHDGTRDGVLHHLQDPAFAILGTPSRNQLQAFLLAFDTGTAPAVGYAKTATAPDQSFVAARGFLLAQSDRRNCDVVVRGVVDGRPAGMVWERGRRVFERDRRAKPPLTETDLDELIAAGRAQVTVMGVPAGQGVRFGVDRDADGVRDGDQHSDDRYGAGTPGFAATLRTNSAPRLGNRSFAMVVEHAPPDAAGFLLVSDRVVEPIRAFGIEVLIDLSGSLALQFRTDTHGVAAVAIPVPDHPALVGAAVYAQGVFGGAAGGGPAATHGLAVHVRG